MYKFIYMIITFSCILQSNEINFDMLNTIKKKQSNTSSVTLTSFNTQKAKQITTKQPSKNSFVVKKVGNYIKEVSHSTTSSSQGGYCSADKECYRIISQSSDRVYIRCQSYNTSEQIVWIDRKSGEYVSSLTSPLAERSHSFKKIANWQCGVY